jgi:hypothetical protein
MPSTLSCSALAAELATTANRATGSVMSQVIVGHQSVTSPPRLEMLPYIKRAPVKVNYAHTRSSVCLDNHRARDGQRG